MPGISRLLAGSFLFLMMMTACNSTQVPDPAQVGTTSVKVSVREGSSAFPDTCSPEDVRDLIVDFLTAFNGGDQAQLKTFFGEWFEWYSVATDANTHVAFYKVADVLPYFAARHAQGEQMKLQDLEVAAGAWHGGIDIVYGIRRTARDLPEPLSAVGKGVVDCKNKTIAVWSMGLGPILD